MNAEIEKKLIEQLDAAGLGYGDSDANLQIRLLNALVDVVVWTESYRRNEGVYKSLNESLSDAKLLIGILDEPILGQKINLEPEDFDE